MFVLTALLLLTSVFAGAITQCNVCNTTVQVASEDAYNISYTLCSFDTLVTASSPNANWLFVGTQCDDRCPTDDVAEGYFCSDDLQGYHELEDGRLGESFRKIEFHHYKCERTNEGIGLMLHMHRFMPNFALTNVSIPYYVSSGPNPQEPSFTDSTKFMIQYP
jgi:hypothetical protein